MMKKVVKTVSLPSFGALLDELRATVCVGGKTQTVRELCELVGMSSKTYAQLKKANA